MQKTHCWPLPTKYHLIWYGAAAKTFVPSKITPTSNIKMVILLMFFIQTPPYMYYLLLHQITLDLAFDRDDRHPFNEVFPEEGERATDPIKLLLISNPKLFNRL